MTDEPHGWQYDPDWRYFVRRDPDGRVTFATGEQVTDDIAHRGGRWASLIGLPPELVRSLMEHPAPGAYNGGVPWAPAAHNPQGGRLSK